jgi:hypothetical protein
MDVAGDQLINGENWGVGAKPGSEVLPTMIICDPCQITSLASLAY